MGNSTDNNGNQPVTQVTRDQMAQNDHDKLVEYGVLLKTIVDGQTRLEQQIKDLIQGQATALASWEAKSQVVHDGHDVRIRKVEDLAVQYVPMINDHTTRIKTLEEDIKTINDDKSQILGGWKAVVMIFGAMAGFTATIILIVNFLITHKFI